MMVVLWTGLITKCEDWATWIFIFVMLGWL